MTNEEIEILNEHCNDVPVRLGELAQALGLEVYQASLKPDISGLIEPSDTANSGFKIRINRHEIKERQRFTLAHELAHYLLHRDLIGGGVVDNVMYRSNLSNRREVEANKLAANIVMPMRKVEEAVAGLDRPIDDEAVAGLAQMFRVSEVAMRIRLGL